MKLKEDTIIVTDNCHTRTTDETKEQGRNGNTALVIAEISTLKYLEYEMFTTVILTLCLMVGTFTTLNLLNYELDLLHRGE